MEHNIHPPSPSLISRNTIFTFRGKPQLMVPPHPSRITLTPLISFLTLMRIMTQPLIFSAEFDFGVDLVLYSLFITSLMTLPMALAHMMNHVKIQLRVFGGITDVDVIVPIGQTAHTALKV
jgi:hypothetical protein